MLNYARLFLILGLAFLVVGGLLYLAARLNLPLGRLPGDIRIQTQNVSCFFPIVTMIVLSVLLTILLNVIIRFWNR